MLAHISRSLDERDIINVDITVYLDGYHGDTSMTFVLPSVDSPGKELTAAANEALGVGINVCGPGVPVNEIGRVIR